MLEIGNSKFQAMSYLALDTRFSPQIHYLAMPLTYFQISDFQISDFRYISFIANCSFNYSQMKITSEKGRNYGTDEILLL